ncbi:hypothetical protein D3C77_342460 [compost metagenome]
MLVSPSTVIILKVTSVVAPSRPCSAAGSTTASVVTKPSIVAMFGWIIPEPFAAPAMLTLRPSTFSVTQTSFLTRSVVRIAWQNSSAPSTAADSTAGSF